MPLPVSVDKLPLCFTIMEDRRKKKSQDDVDKDFKLKALGVVP